jgi:hypothetical protein
MESAVFLDGDVVFTMCVFEFSKLGLHLLPLLAVADCVDPECLHFRGQVSVLSSDTRGSERRGR